MKELLHFGFFGASPEDQKMQLPCCRFLQAGED